MESATLNKTTSKYIEKVRLFAKEDLFDDVIYLGNWRFYRVFKPVRKDDITHYTGFPLYILYRWGKYRWVKNWKESQKILSKFKS